jgi:LPS-assembly lipoprotein
MSSQVKVIFVVLALLALSACGFRPLYGTSAKVDNGSVAHTLAQVQIDNIPEREGQYLRNALIDRFYSAGRPTDPVYTLQVTNLREALTDLDITKSSSATRAQMRIDADIILIDHRGAQTAMTRRLVAITSYNVLDSRFTTRVSEEAARQSALDDLAGQIERHLALFLSGRSGT